MPRLEPNKANLGRFDFVIIGGGTAGCVLANRLSSDGKHTVLVLESGATTQEELLDIRVPLFNSKLKNTTVDWQMKSTAQQYANGRIIGVPQGKVLGGSSAINACLSHRCSPSDYDAWNMPGWEYEQLKHYFCKAETFQNDKASTANELHGQSGPLNVMQQNDDSLLGKHFTKACQNHGMPQYHDITDVPCQIGVTGIQSTVYRGERTSTGSAYLPPDIQRHRLNLSIALNCTVKRIIIDKDTNTATHVEYTSNADGRLYQVCVGKEAILSAGAILSPLLLLSSGIGSKSELEALGITVIADLPGVGKNLQNHWRVPLVHEATRPEMSLHQSIFEKQEESLKRIAESKEPSALSRAWPDAVAYMKVPNAPDNSSSIANTPQIELFTGGLALCRELPKLKDVACASLLMVYIAPFSKGSVTLNPDRTPHIDLALLQDERDLQCLEKGLELSIKIADDKEYRDNCVKRWILHPYKAAEKQEIKQYIKDHVDTLHHYAGTCKMGPTTDRDAVVAGNLKVHGIQGLRVVDASIFPIVPAGQICFPVIACAEKASDLILNDFA
ncbi:choline dehydrogenase [Mucor ambiguus]|uniref:Choline dehydrogenase n=1 Tax=Mucor ambiguus TaxID=91626 RepID=A0A0C9M397_9FUNG|nr:choline dehydrogenase [Mucor ambiguus]